MKLYAQHTIHRGKEVIPARTVFDGTQAELDQFEKMDSTFPAARKATEEEIAIARYEAETANGGRPLEEPVSSGKPAKSTAPKSAKSATPKSDEPPASDPATDQKAGEGAGQGDDVDI